MTEVRNQYLCWAGSKVGRRTSSHLPVGISWATALQRLRMESASVCADASCVPRTQKWVEIQVATGSFVKAKSSDSISGWAKPKQRCSCLRAHSWKLQVFFFSILSSPKPLSIAYFHKNEKTDARKWRAEPKALCWKPTTSSPKQVLVFLNLKSYIFVDKGTPLTQLSPQRYLLSTSSKRMKCQDYFFLLSH